MKKEYENAIIQSIELFIEYRDFASTLRNKGIPVETSILGLEEPEDIIERLKDDGVDITKINNIDDEYFVHDDYLEAFHKEYDKLKQKYKRTIETPILLGGAYIDKLIGFEAYKDMNDKTKPAEQVFNHETGEYDTEFQSRYISAEESLLYKFNLTYDELTDEQKLALIEAENYYDNHYKELEQYTLTNYCKTHNK